MVEQIDGHGRHFRDVSQDLGLNSTNSRRLIFLLDDRREALRKSEAMTQILALDTVHERSFLLTNVRTTEGRFAEALLVPKDCPDLVFSETAEHSLKEGETYLVTVNFRSGRQEIVPVLVDSRSGAEKIALRRMQDEGFHKSDMEANSRLVTPEQWKTRIQELIDSGKKIPKFILKRSGLSDYAAQKQLELKSQAQSDEN